MGRGTTYCGRGVSIAVTSFASFTCAAAARPFEPYAARAPNGCPIIGNEKSLIYFTTGPRCYARMCESRIGRCASALTAEIIQCA